MDEAGAFVHVTRRPGREGADHRAELASLVGQLVLRPRGMVGVEAPAHEAVLLHELEPLGEDVGREAGQAGLQIAEAAGGSEQIAHHEERPAIAPPLEGLCHPAALPVHLPPCARLSEGLTKKQVTIIFPILGPIAAAAAPVPSAPPLAARTRRLLEAPVASTLLWLAAPNVLVMVLQAVVTTMDAVFVGWLGPDALAGVSLVYPLVMLMQTMSGGGMGGGVASAVARALGAGRQLQAERLAAHAILIALGMASLFTVVLLLGGPALFRLMGGQGPALEAARVYSHVIFGGAVVIWLLNTLSSIVRGTGTMIVPAAVTTASAFLYLGLAPALVMGWGPFPRLGVAGAAPGHPLRVGLARPLPRRHAR